MEIEIEQRRARSIVGALTTTLTIMGTLLGLALLRPPSSASSAMSSMAPR